MKNKPANEKKPRPILLLEMNEIPWRLIDKYRSDIRFPNLGRFFGNSETYTTIAVDEGELSPWVTWPSFHRGMGNMGHHVKNLGQDPLTYQGVPIWDEYLRRGHSVGVCGSLQSWPPKNPGPGGFFVPDTFAQDARCYPGYVEPFQEFNLSQVRRNGRVLDKGFPFADVVTLLRSLPKLGIRFATGLKVAQHLIMERRVPELRARRPVFQTVLFWDIFQKVFDPKNPPAFSSFFTNHVAGVMHRYWHHVFPEDFGDRFRSETPVHLGTMDFAMELVERILGQAIQWSELNPELLVVFATSMGQAAVHRDNHEGVEASISGLPKLLQLCGIPPDAYVPLLAMVPQVAAGIASPVMRGRVKSVLRAAVTASGKRLFTVEEIGESLSITIHTPSKDDILAGGMRIAQEESGPDRVVPWEEAGVRIFEIEPGTAYHIPEGVLAIYGEGVRVRDERAAMPASEAKSFLMKLSGLETELEVESEAGPGHALGVAT